MKNSLLLILSVALGLVLMPQRSRAGWTKTLGVGAGKSVKQTADGGYIIAARGGPCLVKTDSTGEIQWTRIYRDEEGFSTEGFSVCETSDGGYAVIGGCAGAWLTHHLWLTKTNASGDTLWTHSEYGGEQCYGSCIIETDDGYVATGDPWSILKFTKAGETLWTRIYENMCSGRCIKETPDGGFVVAGDSINPVPIPEDTTHDLAITKTDAQGNITWIKTYGTIEENEYGYSIDVIEGEGFFVAGVKDDGLNIWLLKTDDEGDTLWTFSYDSAQALAGDLTSDGGYAVTGASFKGAGENLLLLKVSSQGELLWEKEFDNGVFERGYSVQETEDKGFVITGYTQLDTTACVWLIKTDSLGNVGTQESPLAIIPEIKIPSPIGQEIVLGFSDSPKGFHADVFDALGRKMDELNSPNQTGVLIWGKDQSAGVYFIVPQDASTLPVKAVIIR